jgi:hypothetical protein
MKPTPGRIKALSAMAVEGAYVRPDRSIRGCPFYKITADMEALFLRNKFMEEASKRDGLLRVLVITDKGREFLKGLMPNVKLTGSAPLRSPVERRVRG